MKLARRLAMPARFLPRSLVASFATGGLLFGGCSSSSSPPASMTTSPDAGTDAAMTMTTTDSGATLAVSPTPTKVLTCDTLQFTETGGAAGGVWSVGPAIGAGSVGTTGLYAAPTAVPASPDATVSYAVGGESASASLTLGTAFVGPVASVPINGNGFAVPAKPFEKIFSTSGTQVYAGVLGPASASGASEEIDVFASSDSGKTFGAPTAYHTGDVSCGTVVADPGNPSVVYLEYLAGHGDSTSNTGATLRLAVSTDGAKTFPTEYVLADSDNSIASLICPDIVAPSAGHVIVSGALGGDSNPSWIGTFTSGSQGTAIGPVGTEGAFVDAGTDPFVSMTDTNSGSKAACGIYADGSGGSPRIVSNTAGDACIVYQHIEDASCGALSDAVMVQCSANNGSTWTTPVSVATNTLGNTYPTGAVSPGGNIAVAYTKPVTEEAGVNDETFIVVSKDGGKTWSTAVQYPTASWLAVAGQNPASGLSQQALHWESDSILWMSATLVAGNAAILVVDKTCDFGATWSGAVTAGPYVAGGILATGAGIAAGAIVTPNSQNGPLLSLIPLSP
jgi:hypothetical protein